MAVPYSTLLFAGAPPAGTTTDLFTAPAAHTTVIRDIEVVNFGPSAGQILMLLHPFAYFYASSSLGNRGWAQWIGRVVMNPGDVLTANCDASTSFNVVVSGYLLNA